MPKKCRRLARMRGYGPSGSAIGIGSQARQQRFTESYVRLEGENRMKAKGIEKTATVLTKTGALFIGFLLLVSLVFLVILWDVEKAYLLGGALGCLLVLLLPALLSRRYDVFQPLSLAILSVAIGVTGRRFTYYLIRTGRSACFWVRIQSSCCRQSWRRW